MGSTKMVDGQPITVEKVDLSHRDFVDTCRQLGIPTPTRQPRKSTRSPANVQTPYVRTIPLAWTMQASQLPEKALHVSMALWYLAGVTKSTTVTLTRVWLQRFGVQHETGRRGLLLLEEAELVCVQRSGKQSPRVTLMPIPQDRSAGSVEPPTSASSPDVSAS